MLNSKTRYGIMLNALILLLLIILLHGCNKPDYQVIKGGTIIDLSENGTSENDIADGIILIRDGIIINRGSENDFAIPGNARVIDASGKYIIPGLVDGFGTINNQSYANAYLAKGVTSVITVTDQRRGELFPDADPSPRMFKLSDVGFEKVADEELLRQVRKEADAGTKVLLLMYKLTPGQLRLAIKEAKSLGMATMGELGYSSYSDGIDAGVDAFVHSTRYSLDIAPGELRRSVAEDPFSDDLESPKWKYYSYLSEVSQEDEELQLHSAKLGISGTYLMPTISLLYLDLPGHTNPWSDPVASILDPGDINNPADMSTGNHDYDEAIQEAYTSLATNVLMNESTYYGSGAKYLAGSAADVWGTMPGISLHTELKLLTMIGLSTREAIAAATTNFCNAFGWKQTGNVEPGFFADIIILNSNPVDDLANLDDIHMIMLNGEIINRENLLKK